MPSNQTIALDAMGGDFGPEVVIPAAARALEIFPEIKFLLFGRDEEIKAHLRRFPALMAASQIHHTDKVIAADEKPSVALRTGKDSSMRLAIEAVKDGRAQSIVSGGNTGALMATAKLALRTLPGISRPAIASVFPTKGEDTIMLDLGANLACDAEMLVQFAVLGAVYARAVKELTSPTVGLLNIGSEEMKGHEQLKEAARVLSEIDFPGRFVGFVEGNDIPMGSVDVVVTDGFTGNVALKVAEGVGDLMLSFLKDAFRSSVLAKVGALMASGALKKLKHRMDHRTYNGGMFLGLNGICVKSHGGMDVYGYSQAILVAAGLVEKGYNDRVAQEIAELNNQKTTLSGEVGSTVEAAK